jgi:alpha-D-ribose 1-methylphosphonate 5-triphosphate synthase subunit PhnL
MASLELAGVAKTFTMHLQGGLLLPVFHNLEFAVAPGQCVVLAGPSGIGKSSILKLIFGNYRCDEGSILVRDDDAMVDIACASPRQILGLRRRRLAYVSQFLRAVPRVCALDIVADALTDLPRETARGRAAAMLSRFKVPERLWSLPPATFSGGEQQRVNIARGFAGHHALLILDEPTASLDAENRNAVVELIAERRAGDAGFLAIFHDEDVRARLADRLIDVTAFSAREAA